MQFPPRFFRCALVLMLFTLGVGAAHAQEPSAEALKASAYDAQKAAEAARATHEEAQRAAAESAQRLEAAEQAAASATTRADEAATAPVAQDSAEIEKLRAESQAANAKAEEALAAVAELEARFAYDRKGVYAGGGVYWAPSSFDTSFDVDSSRGANAQLGYRLASHFAAEVRGDRLDDFRFSGDDVTGSLSGWGVSANIKAFLLTGRFQPYVSFGVGAMMWDLDYHFLNPAGDVNLDGTDIMFRFAGGAEIYITPSIALNLEAAYASLGGDLSGVKFGQLGGGLTFRF